MKRCPLLIPNFIFIYETASGTLSFTFFHPGIRFHISPDIIMEIYVTPPDITLVWPHPLCMFFNLLYSIHVEKCNQYRREKEKHNLLVDIFSFSCTFNLTFIAGIKLIHGKKKAALRPPHGRHISTLN